MKHHCALSEPFVRSVCFLLRFPLCKVFFVWQTGTMPSLHAKKSKALLDSGFHALDSGFHVLYLLLLLELVFWIPIVSGILYSIKNSFSHFGFYRQKSGRQKSGFLYMWRYILQQQHLTETSLREIIYTIVLDEDQP